MNIKEKIINEYPLTKKIECEFECYEATAHRFVIFYDKPINSANMEFMLYEFGESIKGKYSQAVAVIIVAYTDEEFKKEDIFYFNGIDTYSLYCLLNTNNNKVYFNNLKVFAFDAEEKEFIKRFDQILGQYIDTNPHIKKENKKKELEKYFNSKDKNNYSNLDKIFLFYNDNEFYKILKFNGSENIEFHPIIKSNEKSLQVYFNYYNMSAIMKFDEDFYECCKYKRGCLVNEIDQSTVRKNYDNEFDIKLFVDEFIKSIDSDDRCIKSNDKHKNKKYNVIAGFFLLLPIALAILMPYLSYVLNKKVELGIWIVPIAAICIILWAIFNKKSKKK